MNWLDILLIIINGILFFIGIFVTIFSIKDDEIEIALGFWGFWIIIAIFTICLPFVVIDKASGSTAGTITSVDKNFFGTTSIYIKTSETTQEKYCIEDSEIVSIAKENVGKRVKIEYGSRVGFYSTGKCQQSPVENIERIDINE